MKTIELEDELGECTKEESLDVDPIEESKGKVLVSRGKPSSKHPLGRVAFNTRGLTVFQSKPLESKRDILRDQWASLAYVLLGKANAISQSVTKKDFGRLMQLVTTAGISYDKVFPKVENPSVGNLVVNLFKGLPSEKVLGVLGAAPTPKGEHVDGVS